MDTYPYISIPVVGTKKFLISAQWWNGRHEGLKIPWAEVPVPVRVRSELQIFIKLLSMCEYQWKYQGCPYPICGIIFAPVVCPLDFKSCPNRNLIKNNNGKTKQKFTIEFEYPMMDAKVTTAELRNIISRGLKCFGWDIKVEEE